MKRIIGILLCAVMLFSTISMGVSASYQEHISVSGNTQNIDGVSYKIVTTASQLSTYLAAGGNIMLANDITLTSSSQITIKAGTLFDGNGYSITYNGTLTAPLFVFGTGKQITIRNAQFGTSAVPMTTSGAIGLFQETAGSDGSVQNHIVWQNDTFYVTNTGAADSVGGLIAHSTAIHRFSGSTMNINLTATSGSLQGGWIGSASGELYFDDCVTIGTIKGANGVGGFVGQNTSGRAYFDNCVNHAKVTATGGYCGGFSGNAGLSMSQLYFLNCTNYGAIESTATGYNSVAGGIIGRISNIQCYDIGVNGFYGCVNFGTVTSKRAAGGIVGRHHESDHAYTQYLRFRECINLAQVKATNYAGGILGVASPVVSEVIMDRCANVAKITGSNYVGNFAGTMNNGKLTDCYAAGYIVTGSSTKRGVVAGLLSGNYTYQSGDLSGTTAAITAPTLSNVRYLSNLSASYAQGATLVTAGTAEYNDMLADMKELYGMSFVAADSATVAGGYLVVADPQIRGVQQSTTTTDSKTDIRFAAIINALAPFEKAGFRATIRVNGQAVKVDQTVDTVYSSLNATSVNGTISSVTAKDLSGQYLTAVTFTNIPTTGDVTVEIAPYAVGTDGTEYVGKTRVVVVSKGTCKTESMLLNGVALEKYSIVYPSASSNNEKLLAERLAKKIGEMIGHTVTCYSDATAARSNEIWIGKTNRHTPTVTGRWIYRPNESNTNIVLTATGTTALSEVVEYFLETLVEKRAVGQAAWTISGSISVPIDEELSIMAYNTGALEDTTIMAAEWDLIVDSLPDIFTMQEPWASFLATFFNNYAVKPSTSFKSSSKNVMSTSVNGKAFTGSGYYGVYWGQPRWKSGNANTNGAASYSPILYAKDRFTVNTSKSGTFWLSGTPATSGSSLSSSTHARCATYATLTDKNTGETFVVVNTHLDFSTECKTEQITILLNQLKSKVGTSVPIFITGDMNAQRSDAAMDVYFNNGWTALNNVAEYSYQNNSSIDWLLTNKLANVDVQRYDYLCQRTFYSSLWNEATTVIWDKPSDHAAVMADLYLNTGATRPAANTETPPAAAHAFGDWIADPTTTDSHYRECDCGDREVGVCSWKKTSVLVEATHVNEGQELYTCTLCGRTQVRTIAKNEEHAYSDWLPIKGVDDGHYRDCECGQHEEATCKWKLTEVLKEATVYEEGLELYTCADCGRTEERTVEKLPDFAVDDSNVTTDQGVDIGSDTSTNMGPIVWLT